MLPKLIPATDSTKDIYFSYLFLVKENISDKQIQKNFHHFKKVVALFNDNQFTHPYIKYIITSDDYLTTLPKNSFTMTNALKNIELIAKNFKFLGIDETDIIPILQTLKH